MDADEVLRVLRLGRERGDRQGRGVGAEHDLVAHDCLRFRSRLGLHLAVFEHRLDDQIGALELLIVGRRRDAREQLVGIFLLGAAALDLAGKNVRRIGLAFVGRLLIAVDQHHVDAGLRGHVGDARAHQARADHADLLERRGSGPFRPPRALVQFLHRDEQRADHRRRFGRAHDLGEVARLDAQRRIHWHLQALEHARQDRARGRIVVRRLLAIKRVRGRPCHHAHLRPDRAAGQLEAVDVPRLLRLRRGLDPGLRSADQVRGRDDVVDELHGLGAVEPDLVALEQELERVGRAHHARDALRAACAGEEPDLDLGQAEARLRIVGRDAVMAGKRQLEAAAHRGAVERRDPRLAAGFELAVGQRETAREIEHHRVGGFLALGLENRHVVVTLLFQHREVGAAAERILARGDDRALDGGVPRDLVDQRVELLHDRGVDHVHRLAGHVPGDQRNAVGIDVELEIGHFVSLLGSELTA